MVSVAADIRDRRYLALAVVIVVAGIGGYAVVGGVPGGAATGDVVRALELSTGTDLEVLSVEDQGSLDRIVLSDGSNVIDAYVTDDRRYLVQATRNGQVVQGFVHLNNLTRSLEARNNFISCLQEENARFFGLASQNANLTRHTRLTQLQFQVLGGLSAAADLFGGPGQGRLRQLVLQNGVVWTVNGQLNATGVQTVPRLEQMTGCTYGAATGPSR
ncbi:MAG: hypothetical protein ABEI97_05240 [Candidatus Nanohaloarchaea archaeon]